MFTGKTRAGLMAVVGGYLLYTAWQLFEGRNDPETTMTPTAMFLFISLFVVLGIALAVYACRLWKQAVQEEKEEKKGDPTKLK